jgi:hypothetical protein
LFLRKKKIDDQKIQTKVFKNFLKLIVWTLIVFVLFKGIVNIIDGDQTSGIEADILSETESQELKRITENEVTSFAENFAQDYMTYYGSNEEYEDRLSQYSNLEFKNIQSKTMEVIYLNSTKTKWLNDELLNVDCKLKIDYDNSSTSDDSEESTNGIDELIDSKGKSVNLRVAVRIINGKYLIDSYPTFIGSTSKSSQDSEVEIPGQEVDDTAIKDKINNVIENFISAYCEGNETDMEYFMLNQKNLKGLDNEFELKKINSEDIIIKKDDDIYNVKVNYILSDSENEFLQSMEFILVYKDEKYLIKNFDTALNY